MGSGALLSAELDQRNLPSLLNPIILIYFGNEYRLDFGPYAAETFWKNIQ